MAACLTPFSVENPGFPHRSSLRMIPVPCGKCPHCRQRRANDWCFRLLQEEKRSISSAFLTLTYDTDHVPISDNGFMTLCKADLQKFWKRLRKLHCVSSKDHKVRYYACGEYGARYERPHYHAIVFNVSDVDLFSRAWMLDGVPIGRVHVGDVKQASIMYTVNYMNKATHVPKHSRDDRVREFSNMSKNLGSNFLTPAMREFYKSDLSRQFVIMPDGWKSPLPRYYKAKLYDERELNYIAAMCEYMVDARPDVDPHELHEAVKAAIRRFKDRVSTSSSRPAF